MSGFKENKRNAIEKGKEQGDAALSKGDQRVQELELVKNLIESISLEDEDDEDMAESLNDAYLEAGRRMHRQEVQDVIEGVKKDLEENKAGISAERTNVESATDKVREMQDTTDLAADRASDVENSLQKSSQEYGEMEEQTEEIKTKLEAKSDEILERIENLFE